MTRGRLIRGPDDPRAAFWRGFIPVTASVGVILTVRVLFTMDSWGQFAGFLPYLLAFVFGGGVLAGLVCVIPVLLQGWAWGQLTRDTPVADDDQD